MNECINNNDLLLEKEISDIIDSSKIKSTNKITSSNKQENDLGKIKKKLQNIISCKKTIKKHESNITKTSFHKALLIRHFLILKIPQYYQIFIMTPKIRKLLLLHILIKDI